MDDLISRFRDYQIEWLTAHNDIEFCEEEEKLLIGFLKDTAECFVREETETWNSTNGKSITAPKGTFQKIYEDCKWEEK